MSQRLSRSLPWVGGVIALLTIAAAMRRKGVIGGTLDAALDALPFVGGMKNAVEIVRGRDLIRDRPAVRRQAVRNAGESKRSWWPVSSP